MNSRSNQSLAASIRNNYYKEKSTTQSRDNDHLPSQTGRLFNLLNEFHPENYQQKWLAYPFKHVAMVIIPSIRDIHAKNCSHQRIEG
jgi:hypothetical protein